MSKAYLKGMLHDSTERDYTYRISQKNRELVEKLSSIINDLGFKSWIYEEGGRGVHVVEFSKQVLQDFEISSESERKDYVRGYFDAEGSVPKSQDVRFYIYFAQKDEKDLKEVKNFLEEFDINTGKLHRPSKTAKPDYWRFYISSKSHQEFARKIGSWHPRKNQLLREMIQSAP
ncbi:MAG: LAGLIDADG family homing endonuclease [Candidatus Nanohaloarchaea archaeon]